MTRSASFNRFSGGVPNCPSPGRLSRIDHLPSAHRPVVAPTPYGRRDGAAAVDGNEGSERV